MNLAGAMPLSLAGGRVVKDKNEQRKAIALFSYHSDPPYRIFEQLEHSSLEYYQFAVCSKRTNSLDCVSTSRWCVA